MNALRMPAVQTLLLFSPSIDTDNTFSRLVCDSWIELKFVDSSAAQSLLLRACQLRHRSIHPHLLSIINRAAFFLPLNSKIWT